MAVTLESVMRMNDEFSATLSKYASEVDAAKKKTDEAKVSGTSLGSTFKNIGALSGTATTGISGLVGKLTTLVSGVYLAKKAFDLLKESIQTAAQQQVQKSTMQSLMGNAQLGTDLYNFVGAYAKKSALDRENLTSATTSYLAYTKDVNQLQQMLNLTQRLYSFNPAQGAEGAVFAMKEAFAGETRSLRTRFNMTGISADTIEKNFKKGDINATLKYLDQEFNQFGATQGVVNANFNSLSIQAQLFKTNLMSAIGDQSNSAVSSLSQTFQRLNADMDAGKFQPFFSLMSQGTASLANGLSWVAQNANILAPIVVGVTTAIIGYNIAMGTATLVTSLFSAAAGAATGRWLAVGATIAAVAATAATIKGITDNATKSSSTTALTTAQAAAKLAADQKAQGASTKGLSASIPTNVTNSSPIKVSGTVEIAKENLKYAFDAATAKFYAQFNATKVTPVFTIQHQDVHQEADVQQINKQLAGMITEAAGVTAGGSYK